MKRLFVAMTLVLGTQALAEQMSLTINNVKYICTQASGSGPGSAACACRKKDELSYSVFYWNSEEWNDVGRSRYSNVADCVRAMNSTEEFRNICN